MPQVHRFILQAKCGLFAKGEVVYQVRGSSIAHGIAYITTLPDGNLNLGLAVRHRAGMVPFNALKPFPYPGEPPSPAEEPFVLCPRCSSNEAMIDK